jgi:hypothetical protein
MYYIFYVLNASRIIINDKQIVSRQQVEQVKGSTKHATSSVDQTHPVDQTRTPSTKRKRTPSNGYGKRNVTGGKRNVIGGKRNVRGGMTKAESYAINGAALGAIKGAVGGYMTGWAINKASPSISQSEIKMDVNT